MSECTRRFDCAARVHSRDCPKGDPRQAQALAWAEGAGFAILRDRVFSTQWDDPPQRYAYGMDCDPRDLLIDAYLALAPDTASQDRGVAT